MILEQRETREVISEIKNEQKYSITPFVPVIGTDESGKGDYFGPLVSAGVYVNLTTKPLLEKIGVKDSKKLNDNQILNIAPNIRKICANQFAVIEIPLRHIIIYTINLNPRARI